MMLTNPKDSETIWEEKTEEMFEPGDGEDSHERRPLDMVRVFYTGNHSNCDFSKQDLHRIGRVKFLE